MKLSFLDFLCCPQCQSDLHLQTTRGEGKEIIAGKLDCLNCGQTYPIQEGIPRFKTQQLQDEAAQTIKNFGASWIKFSWLDPSYEQQFLDWIHPVNRNFFEGKTILDAGCGKGRHLVWAQRFKAKAVFGIDLSDAVQVAYRHTRQLPNVHVAQADIYHPPLRSAFHYIYSLGVLQHLPDPEKGFHSLAKLLRPGGSISIWVYGRENNSWIIWFINPLRRAITSRMGPWGLQVVSGAITACVLWPLLKLVYAPSCRLFPRLARRLFYGEYLCYISKFPFRDINSIVFDHLTPSIAHYLKREEIVRWFQNSNFREVQIQHHNRNSWKGFGTRSRTSPTYTSPLMGEDEGGGDHPR
ncbi:MAG: methyltransferase domain-containing protein [Elusimicrobia bacterium]|nr:methyltransferase domain-containing protein [Elusimicrobiota bacterium]